MTTSKQELKFRYGSPAPQELPTHVGGSELHYCTEAMPDGVTVVIYAPRSSDIARLLKLTDKIVDRVDGWRGTGAREEDPLLRREPRIIPTFSM